MQVYLSEALETLLPLTSQKMKEDNIGQLYIGDYDAPLCEQQYTHGSCYLFVQIQII